MASFCQNDDSEVSYLKALKHETSNRQRHNQR